VREWREAFKRIAGCIPPSRAPQSRERDSLFSIENEEIDMSKYICSDYKLDENVVEFEADTPQDAAISYYHMYCSSTLPKTIHVKDESGRTHDIVLDVQAQ
jgi:hypothetical protein